MATKIAIDAGHGGRDPGAVYEGRQEKNDNLDLALAVGEILSENGFDIIYTRTDDVYNTPYEKAMIANQAGADFFISFHRNATVTPNTANGAQVLVYSNDGIRGEMAANILAGMVAAGFADRGIEERPNLVVLRRTTMPSVLIEAGFIDSDIDNAIFDENFDILAEEIAQAIITTLEGGMSAQSEEIYRVQVGAFRNEENARNLVTQLEEDGFPAVITLHDGYYRVQVGAFSRLENAVRMEQVLRQRGYSTYITT